MNMYFAQDVCQHLSPYVGVAVMSARIWKVEDTNLLETHHRLLPKMVPDNDDWKSQVCLHFTPWSETFHSHQRSLSSYIWFQFFVHTYTDTQKLKQCSVTYWLQQKRITLHTVRWWQFYISVIRCFKQKIMCYSNNFFQPILQNKAVESSFCQRWSIWHCEYHCKFSIKYQTGRPRLWLWLY